MTQYRIEDIEIYFVDESNPKKRGKPLTNEDKRNWFWGIVSMLHAKEKPNDPESEAQKMYRNILIF